MNEITQTLWLVAFFSFKVYVFSDKSNDFDGNVFKRIWTDHWFSHWAQLRNNRFINWTTQLQEIKRSLDISFEFLLKLKITLKLRSISKLIAYLLQYCAHCNDFIDEIWFFFAIASMI